ncbi:MAG: phage integrase N-terminal SAM-like domain-containing protein [Candidatus Loosdrechtia sp.]|uniref:phage integrase N-terminal SAM-like domain-containing protein n=1 Tax=Candidatus Loosdrechtia sp. TaxID=3101272 RepID=UPI00403ACF89
MATKSGALSGKEWDKVYSDLYAEIKVRHYSLKTLRSYSTWVRKFQAFTKGKKPSDLNPSDVKDFICFLAVQCRVSASSQTPTPAVFERSEKTVKCSVLLAAILRALYQGLCIFSSPRCP